MAWQEAETETGESLKACRPGSLAEAAQLSSKQQGNLPSAKVEGEGKLRLAYDLPIGTIPCAYPSTHTCAQTHTKQKSLKLF